ncbi:MAG: hypothetical protein ACXIVE_05945 [Salinarimonas sp.]
MSVVCDYSAMHMFEGAVNMAMEHRLTASPEYHDLLSSLVGQSYASQDELRQLVRHEVSSRSTPLMAELLRTLEADWQDWDAHRLKHRNAGRPVYPAVKRIKKKIAKANA